MTEGSLGLGRGCRSPTMVKLGALVLEAVRAAAEFMALAQQTTAL